MKRQKKSIGINDEVFTGQNWLKILIINFIDNSVDDDSKPQ